MSIGKQTIRQNSNPSRSDQRGYLDKEFSSSQGGFVKEDVLPSGKDMAKFPCRSRTYNSLDPLMQERDCSESPIQKIRLFGKVKAANFRFQWQAAKKYYPRSLRFALCDIALGAFYFFFNPYRICRKSGEVYGETPPASLHRIISFCSVSKEDTWIELGSGRGKGAFWVANFVGCRTIGIEKVGLFYRIAKAIRFLFSIPSLEFLCQDILETDFSQASFVYLYSTCTEESLLSSLTKKMGAMRPGAKVITISSPLPSSPLFQTVGAFPISFPWGDTQAYINERQPS